MNIFLRSIVAFVIGAIATYIVIIGVFMAYVEIFKVVDRDGGMSMAAFLVLGPFCALVVGVVAAIVTAMRTRRSTALAEPAAPIANGSSPLRLVITGLLAVTTIYAGITLVQWISGGARGSSVVNALIYVAVAAVAFVFTRRSARQ
jgi:hypothetical protein